MWLPLAGGALLFAGFIVWEWRSAHPMLPLSLFRRRNFAIGNVETFSMYAGLGLLFFFLDPVPAAGGRLQPRSRPARRHCRSRR